MYEELWSGAALKIDNARFFLESMGKSLRGPERSQINVALQSSGAIVDTQWQRSFYAYLDGFLAMARSVPEIIHCCFGADQSGPMRPWFDALSDTERIRRQRFTEKFRPALRDFSALPLSTARNIVLHRTGVPPVEVQIKGRFGISHVGTAVARVPIAESRPIAAGDDPSAQWASTLPPVPLEPRWTDFILDGKPLFTECQTYLQKTEHLLAHARIIAKEVHGTDGLTTPIIAPLYNSPVFC